MQICQRTDDFCPDIVAPRSGEQLVGGVQHPPVQWGRLLGRRLEGEQRPPSRRQGRSPRGRQSPGTYVSLEYSPDKTVIIRMSITVTKNLLEKNANWFCLVLNVVVGGHRNMSHHKHECLIPHSQTANTTTEIEHLNKFSSNL